MDDRGKIFLTAEEIGKFFMIPLNTVYRLSKCGKIKGIKIGKKWRYLKEDIEELLSRGISPRILPARKNSEFKERRMYPRMNCNILCEYTLYIPSIKELHSITGIIKNISGGGIFLCDNSVNLAKISIGDPLELEFEVGEEDYISINTKGRVVWGVENENRVYGIGVKFRNIDKEFQEKIINFVG